MQYRTNSSLGSSDITHALDAVDAKCHVHVNKVTVGFSQSDKQADSDVASSSLELDFRAKYTFNYQERRLLDHLPTPNLASLRVPSVCSDILNVDTFSNL